MAQATAQTTDPESEEWGYEDYLNLPDDGNRYEIIEGTLYMTNEPDIDHQFTVMEIAFQIRTFINQNPIGYVLIAPFEVHLSEKSRPVQPDVLFIRKEKFPKPGVKYFEGSPDLVVEVLSPSSRRTDQVIKFMAYEKAGVSEYWIVDTKTRSVNVFILDKKNEYTLFGEFTGEENIESSVLSGLKVSVSSFFMKK